MVDVQSMFALTTDRGTSIPAARVRAREFMPVTDLKAAQGKNLPVRTPAEHVRSTSVSCRTQRRRTAYRGAGVGAVAPGRHSLPRRRADQGEPINRLFSTPGL